MPVWVDTLAFWIALPLAMPVSSTTTLDWSLVIYLYFRFWYAFSMTYTYEPGRSEGLTLLTKGPLAFNFWAGEIL